MLMFMFMFGKGALCGVAGFEGAARPEIAAFGPT
jgi:hypothetical protein